jgi:hypothetical protein
MIKFATASLALALVAFAGAASAQTGMTTGAMSGSMSTAKPMAAPMAKPMSKMDMRTMDKCKAMTPDAMAKSKKCAKVMAMAHPMAAAPMATPMTPAPMAPAGAMSGAMSGATPMKK